MGTDATEAMGFKIVVGNNLQICLSTDSEEETDKLYKGLSAGGEATMPPAKMFWGAYFGQCTDKFGVLWMFSFDPNHH